MALIVSVTKHSYACCPGLKIFDRDKANAAYRSANVQPVLGKSIIAMPLFVNCCVVRTVRREFVKNKKLN